MDFVKFLESLKTDKNKTFLENVAIDSYKSLFEEILPPSKPEETELLINKTEEDLEDLEHLQATQVELKQNEADLKQKAPNLVKDTP